MIFKHEPSMTELEIQRLIEERSYADPTSEEYKILNARIKELMELKEIEKKPKFQVSGDTVVKIGALLLLGGLIVFKEELVGPVVSKALGIATKLV